MLPKTEAWHPTRVTQSRGRQPAGGRTLVEAPRPPTAVSVIWSFVIGHWSFNRHSNFVIRHSQRAASDAAPSPGGVPPPSPSEGRGVAERVAQRGRSVSGDGFESG